MEIKITWSKPIKIFEPGKYNTAEKFIEHLRKLIEEIENPLLDMEGVFMFLSGQLKPQEKLSVVSIEGSAERTIREHLYKKKGHVRELKCIYKNYKDETLYLKIGALSEINPDILKYSVCSLIDYVDPSCSEKCTEEYTKLEIINIGNYFPLPERLPLSEEE
ncbi:hypothetical protein [Persephonella sp.]|uniref:hypothetical protein n=1 Tax=Persephonella sp. TaxID=2060922 RepID=UPI002611E463|nr:hypothetical protein [Persephonella sp.]